jgi:uncharacterized oxidoreductase
MELKNREILITGGGSGIGFSLAKRFVAAGNKVLICGRRKEVLEKARQEISELGTLLYTVQCDISDKEERQRLLDTTLNTLPKLSVLINNAGIQRRVPPIIDQRDTICDEEEFRINYFSPVGLTKLFLPHLTAQSEAMIVNVTSGLAFSPLAFMPNYCATKAALHSWTLSLRHQLRNSSVAVVEMIPPKVNTDLGGKGLHDDGVPVEEYVDSAFHHMCQGATEFGFGFSEANRNASRDELNAIFKRLNG